jgi:hypothetical protein
MASVETELWNIFSFYTLHGNPLDPEHIRVRRSRHFSRRRSRLPRVPRPAFLARRRWAPAGFVRTLRRHPAPRLLARCLPCPAAIAQCTQFVKLARDCQLVGTTLSEASPPLLEADIQVVYTAEVKRLDRGAAALQKMNYNDFLTALMKIAIKVYPRSHTGACSRHSQRGSP